MSFDIKLHSYGANSPIFSALFNVRIHRHRRQTSSACIYLKFGPANERGALSNPISKIYSYIVVNTHRRDILLKLWNGLLEQALFIVVETKIGVNLLNAIGLQILSEGHYKDFKESWNVPQA